MVLFAIAGIASMGFKGLFIGAIGGAVFAIPLLLFCEMSIAIIAVEENTRK